GGAEFDSGLDIGRTPCGFSQRRCVLISSGGSLARLGWFARVVVGPVVAFIGAIPHISEPRPFGRVRGGRGALGFQRKKIIRALESTMAASTPGMDLRSARPVNFFKLRRERIACAVFSGTFSTISSSSASAEFTSMVVTLRWR